MMRNVKERERERESSTERERSALWIKDGEIGDNAIICGLWETKRWNEKEERESVL